MIGLYGSFFFGKSFGKWQSFFEVKRIDVGRYERADIWLNKPLTERAGPGLIELEVKMNLLAATCGDPRPIISELHFYERNQLAATLILGGKPMGPRASMFTLDEVDETQHHWLRDGTPLKVELTLAFTEYWPNVQPLALPFL